MLFFSRCLGIGACAENTQSPSGHRLPDCPRQLPRGRFPAGRQEDAQRRHEFHPATPDANSPNEGSPLREFPGQFPAARQSPAEMPQPLAERRPAPSPCCQSALLRLHRVARFRHLLTLLPGEESSVLLSFFYAFSLIIPTSFASGVAWLFPLPLVVVPACGSTRVSQL